LSGFKEFGQIFKKEILKHMISRK